VRYLVYELLSKEFNVYIFAPKEINSGNAASITLRRGLSITNYAKNKYYVDGTTADCVKLGLFYLKEMGIHIDFVVSGCNEGSNVGHDIMYSGTIGGCIEANLNGVSAFAVSSSYELRFVREHFEEVFYMVFNKMKDYKEIFLININFPINDEYKGIRYANARKRDDINFFEKKKDGKYYSYRDIILKNDEENDMFLIENGFVAISSLDYTINNEEKNKIFKKIFD